MKERSGYILFGFFIGVAAASLLFAAFRPSNQAQGPGSQVRRMRIAHVLPTSHPVHAGLEHLAERAGAVSGGRLKLDVFPNGQLGNETQNLEQLQSGTLDITKVSTATVGSFVSAAKVFGLPYLFRDEDHYWNVLSGGVGQELLDVFAANDAGKPSGFRGLTYYDSGSRNFYAGKAVKSPADLKGMKIRVMNDPVAMDMVESLGASPTPIAWGELYTALQQGVVDGAENNPPSFVSSRHFEVCKEFSFDHHSRIPDVVLISSKAWDSLTEEEQGWLKQAARESSVAQRKAWAQGVEDALEQMRSEGVTIYEPDIAPFMEATQPVRDKYAGGQLKTLMDKIQSAR